MNAQIDDIVSEITCMNNALDSDSTYDDFLMWLDIMIKRGYDKEEYPNFEQYYKAPGHYWQFVKRRL